MDSYLRPQYSKFTVDSPILNAAPSAYLASLNGTSSIFLNQNLQITVQITELAKQLLDVREQVGILTKQMSDLRKEFDAIKDILAKRTTTFDDLEEHFRNEK